MRLGLSIEEARTLGSELMRRRREIDALEVAWSVDAAGFAESGYHLLEGSASGNEWLRHNCQMGRGAVGDRICLGQQIDRLPESLKAMHEEEVGFGHLVVLARTAECTAERFDERVLLPHAREQSVGRFHFTCD